MAWLLIDNSNSRTKFRLGDAEGLKDWREIMPTDGIGISSVRSLTEGLEISGVVVASVVPKKERLLRQSFEGVCQYHQLTSRSPLRYGFDLEHPEQIGHDRLANALALKTNYGAPGIAVDFGTAVTFSVISSNGNFAGGVIAPGMECMTDYLSSRTAQLPKVGHGEIVSPIGRTTEEAMRIGAVTGHRGMVREILRELVAGMTGSPVIVATGGGAAFAAKELPEIHTIDPDLTLEGLRIVAENVF